jgi:hypothetical protein
MFEEKRRYYNFFYFQVKIVARDRFRRKKRLLRAPTGVSD